MADKRSIDFLQRNGIEFKRHKTEGMEVDDFAALLMGSGLVLNDNMCWITFHGLVVHTTSPIQ